MPQKKIPLPPPPEGTVDASGPASDQSTIGPDTGPKSTWDFPELGSLAANYGVGFAKGLGETVAGGGQMIRRYMPFMNDLPSIPYSKSYIEPSNYQQKVGAGTEHMLEYAMLGNKVPFTMLSQGLAAAGLAGAHSGGDPSTMLGTGITAALLTPATAKVSQWLKGAPQAVRAWWQNNIPTPPPGAGGGAAGAGMRTVPQLPGGGQAFVRTVRGVNPPNAPPGITGNVQQPPPGQGQLGPDSTFYQTGNPQGQISGSRNGQVQLPPGPTPPRQLNAAPGAVLPPGTESPVTPDPRLPARYANTPGPTAPTGTMGGMNLGEEGGIPASGEQTATGIKVHISVRDPKTGLFRKATDAERDAHINQYLQDRGTAGRTAAETPAEPPKPPAPPTPPKRGKK
jgi:hypothetical protein